VGQPLAGALRRDRDRDPGRSRDRAPGW
jgi:hypothetical protein